MTDKPQVHDANGMTRSDITSEAWREYIFTDGFVHRIYQPVTLYIKRKSDGDSHRIVDDTGIVYYIPVGWRILRWKNKPGLPEVEF